MRNLAIIAALIATPAVAQVSNPPIINVDTSAFASKTAVEAAQQAAADAKKKADDAAAAVNATIKTVNGVPPVNGNVAIPIPTMPDMSNYATTATVSNMVNSATAGVVKTVNSTTPNASGAVTLTIPTAATTVPPGVADTGTTGTMTTQYALANHTHASKARKIRAVSAADGSYVWTFATPFTTGTSPICTITAETTAGVTDVINAQIESPATATSVNIRINRASRSVASLLGLTVLSIPATPGATPFHAICLEP